MKTHHSLLLIALLSLPVLGQSKPDPPTSGPIALTIIIDTRSSCGNDIRDLRALCRQAITFLRPEDYLEIVSAHEGKAKIRLAQAIKTGDTREIKGITTIVNSIHTGFLSGSNVSNALDLAIRRLGVTCAKKSYDNAAIIILTDGQISDSDSKQVVSLAKRISQKGWKLYLTGSEKTNRNLLIGANEKTLTWSLISQSSLVIWLKPLIEPNEPAPESIPTDQMAAPIHETPVIPLAQPSNEPTLEEKQPDDTKKANISVETRIDSTVSINPKIEPPSELITEQLFDLQKDIPEQIIEAPVEPIRPPREYLPAKKPSRPPSKIWSRLKSIIARPWFWIIAIGSILLIAIAFVLLGGLRKARRWNARISSRLRSSQTKISGILIAKVNGQTHQLGQFHRFNSAHIGRGSGNSIKIADKDLAERHLKLYKKGNNIMAQNLARSPVTVNGANIKPKQKQRLTLPSVIQLNDKIKVALSILKPSQEPVSNRSDQNGKQQQ